ncbi:MAG TPA: ankyrin repeat domain-containing protein [Candidatus Elarobacter sp.]
MPTLPLPARPSLVHLKHQAKDLMRDHRARAASAAQRIREFHPRYRAASDAAIAEAPFSLADAQLTIAREYGFATWPRLRAHVENPQRPDLARPHHERIDDTAFRRAVDLLDAGDAAALRDHLTSHPGLVRQRVTLEGGNYFTNPELLEFIAENPTRRGTLPPSIVDVATVILDAGAAEETDGLNSALDLVASSSIARECAVQQALIDLLCDRGADPNRAVLSPLLYGEFESVEALLHRGAKLTLTIAAATGRVADARAVLPAANDDERQTALALAAQFDHVEIVRMLLDAGEDPNRYSPVGGHSHATPLHQAALAGHESVARLLAERGARLDIEDLHYHATPLGWARYAGRDAVAAYLESKVNA